MENLIVAVIDMGSNSFRMQISEVMDGIYKVVEDYKETVRIGDFVYRDGKFPPEATEIIIGVLHRMKTIMGNMHVSVHRVVGTAPFRDAENAKEVVEEIKSATGFSVDIITGEEEAALTYLAATSFFDLKKSMTLFVDVGGGSTELSFAEDGKLLQTISTPLGCTRLTQKYFRKNKASSEEAMKLYKKVTQELGAITGIERIDKLVFTGGTVNNLAQVYIRRMSMSDTAVKYVDSVFFNHFINELVSKSYEERGKISGLESARADIALAAAMIVQVLLKKFRTGGFYTFSGGLRNGITIDLLNKMGIQLIFQNNYDADVRYFKLMETGRKYNYEEGHALQVTNLAQKLFEQLKKTLKLQDKDWFLLEAASILHDIGQHIAYSKHHRHSYYLIHNTELVGYTDMEREIIANIARYHRRSVPKDKDENFIKLADGEKVLVIKLAAILRVADALDRSHIASVTDIETKITDKEIKILISSDAVDVEMELMGLNKKKDLLEDVSGRKVTGSRR